MCTALLPEHHMCTKFSKEKGTAANAQSLHLWCSGFNWAIGCTTGLLTVIMPCVAMRVHEKRHVWKLIVVLDNVGQVNHRLMPFILRYGVRGGTIVDDVVKVMQVRNVPQMLRKPCGIFFLRGSDNECAGQRSVDYLVDVSFGGVVGLLKHSSACVERGHKLSDIPPPPNCLQYYCCSCCLCSPQVHI